MVLFRWLDQQQAVFTRVQNHHHAGTPWLGVWFLGGTHVLCLRSAASVPGNFVDELKLGEYLRYHP